MNKTLFLIFLLLVFSPAYAATYYIDGTLSDDCDGTNFHYDPATRTCNAGAGQIAWQRFASANPVLTAGNTAHIRGGTYTIGASNSLAEGIQPKNSGESGKPITYTVYEDEVVNLVGQADDGHTYSVGIWINGKSYIQVDGKSLGQLNLSKMAAQVVIGPTSGNAAIGDSTNNEIAYVYAYNSFRSNAWQHSWQGSAVWQRAFFNHIHHCKFEKHGWIGKGPSDAEGNLFELGTESARGEDERTSYNVIEDNEFLYGGHATFGLFGDHNIVRDNYFHNEGWEHIEGGYYGYRNIISNGVSGYVGHNLFEGNRIGHAAPNYTFPGKDTHWGGQSMKLCTPYNILRYNAYFNNSASGLSFGSYSGIYTAKGDHNYAYNNTFYNNGHYVKLPTSETWNCSPVIFGWTHRDDYPVSYGSVLKNNLYFGNATAENCCVNGPFRITSSDWPEVAWEKLTNPVQGNVSIENNFNGETGQNTNPEFVDTTLTSYNSQTLPNLNLQTTSPAVDAGTFLTLADGQGTNSTTLMVDDARYFQDGNFGQGALVWPSSVEIHADWIAIGSGENVVQIQSIDYATNTITLASPMTWQDQAPIWLYKKSDGVQVLYDDGPDMGAYEYGTPSGTPDPDPSPPTPGSSGGGCFMEMLFW